MLSLTGHCFCGKVKISTECDAIRTIASHSKEDRQFSGAPFYVWLEPMLDRTIIEGEVTTFHYNRCRRRIFCSDCGSPLLYQNDTVIRIPTGIFEEAFRMLPRAVEGIDEKLSWIEDHEKTVRKLNFIMKHPTMHLGITGERFIASKTQAFSTRHKSSYDLEVRSGQRIEVKSSGLNRSNKRSPSTRWAWARVASKTNYDWLVLLGEIDERYRHQYKFPENNFVCFLIPYPEVKGLCIGNDIQLNANPQNKKSKASPAFERFQVDESEILSLID